MSLQCFNAAYREGIITAVLTSKPSRGLISLGVAFTTCVVRDTVISYLEAPESIHGTKLIATGVKYGLRPYFYEKHHDLITALPYMLTGMQNAYLHNSELGQGKNIWLIEMGDSLPDLMLAPDYDRFATSLIGALLVDLSIELENEK